MKRQLKIVPAIALCVIAAVPAGTQAATIASWNLFTTDGGATNPTVPSTYSSVSGTGTAAAGITNADISRNGALTYASASFGFNSAAWDSNSADNVGVGFTVGSGGPWSVSDFIFGIRSSATGPGPVKVYTTVDNGTPTLLTTLNSTTTYVGYDLTLNDTVNSSLLVSFVAAGTNTTGGAIGATGTVRLVNFNDLDGATNYVQFTGTKVPEPASFGLAVVGGLALLAFRRRRRSA